MAEEKKQEQAVAALEELEKSWKDSKALLLELLGGAEEIQKSTPDKEETEKKGEENLKKSEDEKKEEQEEEKEDDEEEETEETEKSLEETIVEDPEAAAAMDVEPFLRQFVKSLDEKFNSISETIKKVAADARGSSKAQKILGKALADLGDQQIAIAKAVEVIGGMPVPSRSVLRKSGDRFDGQGATNDLNMSREQILEKALKLKIEGKLESLDVTKIENRLNKGMPLPEPIMKVLKEEK